MGTLVWLLDNSSTAVFFWDSTLTFWIETPLRQVWFGIFFLDISFYSYCIKFGLWTATLTCFLTRLKYICPEISIIKYPSLLAFGAAAAGFDQCCTARPRLGLAIRGLGVKLVWCHPPFSTFTSFNSRNYISATKPPSPSFHIPSLTRKHLENYG